MASVTLFPVVKVKQTQNGEVIFIIPLREFYYLCLINIATLFLYLRYSNGTGSCCICFSNSPTCSFYLDFNVATGRLRLLQSSEKVRSLLFDVPRCLCSGTEVLREGELNIDLLAVVSQNPSSAQRCRSHFGA